MKTCILLILFLLARPAQAVNADACQKLTEAVSKSSFSRFKSDYRKMSINNIPDDMHNFYEIQFSSEIEKNHYQEEAAREIRRERQIISQFALTANHARTAFNFKSTEMNGRPPLWPEFAEISGEVLQTRQFKDLNRELGPSGVWLIFRSYSWNAIGYPEMAGPHMSMIIGDRHYEIGRGPLAMSIDQFLMRNSRESKAVNSRPGVFLAVRVSGVGEEALKALAKYYEDQASLFRSTKKFKYAVDPSQDPEGRNCVTYLTEPILNKELTGGIDLRYALGLKDYTVSPVGMLYENAGLSSLKISKKILFVDDEEWRTGLDLKIATGDKIIDRDNFGSEGYYLDETQNHPQLRGFFVRRISFFKFPQ